MIVSDITDLKLYGIFERGIPNKERIVFRANEPVNLGQYGVMLGIRVDEGRAIPIQDNLFWFGDGIIARGDWVFVYTCLGKSQIFPVPNSNEKMYTAFWGRKNVILENTEIVPILFRVDAVAVDKSPPLLRNVASKPDVET